MGDTHRLGQLRRGERDRKYNEKEVIKLYKSGEKVKDIGEKLSITRSTIWKTLKKYNITIRKTWSTGEGRHKDNCGYIKILKPNHPRTNCQGYVSEHRLVMEEKLGRFLTKIEVVHHIDYNRSNNNPDNLELFENIRTHNDYHGMLRHFVRQMIQMEVC